MPPLRTPKTERDVIKAIEKAGGTWRRCKGSHAVWHANGVTGTFPVVHGGKDRYPTGTAHAIAFALAKAGIFLALVAAILFLIPVA